MKRIILSLAVFLFAAAAWGQLSNPASTVTGTPSPLTPFSNGPLNAKTIMLSGDSTTAIAPNVTMAICNRSGPGQEFPNILCAFNSTYSIDGSKNVTVVTTGNLPVNCIVGAYVSQATTGTFNSNAVGSVTPTFQITAVTSTSYTYNNASATASVGSTAANGWSSCSIINNGSNGQTQNGFNSASGVGSLAFINTIKPDLNIQVGLGINDVRGGAVSATQLEGYIKTDIDSVRSNSATTAILLVTPNSLLANDVSSFGYLTSPSTTSSTAVGGAGSVTITLASMLNSIAPLITPDLTIAQESGNTQLGAYTSGVSAGTAILSAHLIVDDGSHGTQETVPITAINLGAGTVTATFANAHTSGFTVAPTLATMAQAYSNIIHDSVMSFEAQYPNVMVLDTQGKGTTPTIYGRLTQNGPTILMANALHPTSTGYDYRGILLASVINKALNFGGSHGSATPAAVPPDLYYGRVAQYSQIAAEAAINGSFTAPWVIYPQVLDDPDYYTSICEGSLSSYTSSSSIVIAAEVDSGLALGACGVQAYDVVDFVGFGAVQLTSAAASSYNAGNTSITAGVPAISYTMPSSTPVRIKRPLYVDSTAVKYGRQPNIYVGRYVTISSFSTTSFFFQAALPPDPLSGLGTSAQAYTETFNPATDFITVAGVGDLSTIVGSYTSMSCSYSSAFNSNLCTGGSAMPTMSSAYAQVWYKLPRPVQVAKGFSGTSFLSAPLLEALPPTDGTNVAGINQTIQCGQGTGTGAICQTIIKGPALGTGSGTTYQSHVNRVVYNDNKSLTSGAATTLVSIPLGTLTGAGGNVAYHVRATDGTNTCVLDGVVSFSAENSAAVFVTNTSKLGTEATACTAGSTLTDTFAITSANPALLQITPTTSMTATTFTVVYEVHSMGESSITP